MEALSVDDVYTLAEEIGKEFEIVIDNHGVDAVKKLMTKVICVLEYLEAYALKYDSAREKIAELRAQVYQLERDKDQKAQSRNKMEKEMEQYEDVWRQEMEDLGGLVARLQEENSKLSSSLRAQEGSSFIQPHSLTQDLVVLERLRDTLDKQSGQLRLYEGDLACKARDLDALEQRLEVAERRAMDEGRQRRTLQSQMLQLCEEKAQLHAQLAEHKSQLGSLQHLLGTAVRDHQDLLLTASEGLTSTELRGKMVVDLEDPNRPRFTLDELKNILFERNELKARLSDLEDELAIYRPRCTTHVAEEDNEPAVQGPINREPHEKLFSLGRASGIRKFLKLLLGEEP